MRNKLLALIFLLCLPVSLWATAIRMTATGADGKPMVGGKVVAKLEGCGANRPQIVGVGPLMELEHPFTIGAGGRIVDTLVGNDQLTCNGIKSTWWRLTGYDGKGTPVWSKTYIINGATWNGDTAKELDFEPTQVPVQAVVRDSALDQTINQTNGSKLTINGPVLLTGGVTFSQAINANVSGTATSLAADPTDCTGNNWSKGINAAGTAQCAQVDFSNLSGTATLAQIPGSIPNTKLTNSSVTVTAGTGLTGGGSVALGGTVTLSAAQNIATTASPTFAAVTATTFTGALSGNATTATSLAGTPAACTGNNWLKSFTAAGVTSCTQPASTNLSDSAQLVRNNAAQSITTSLTVVSNAIGTVPLVSKSFTGQTGNLFEAQDSTGAALMKVLSNGTVSAASYQVNGTALASSNLSDGSSLAKLNGTPDFTGTSFTISGPSYLFKNYATDSEQGYVLKRTDVAGGRAWYWSQRPSSQTYRFLFYSYDGTTFRNYWHADFDGSFTFDSATVNASASTINASALQIAGSPLNFSHLAGTLALNKLQVCTVDGQIPKWTSAGGWACASDMSNATGAIVFTQLTDVPNAYTGQQGKALRVNAGATGLEFYDATGLSSGATNTWSAEQIFSVSPTLNNNIPLHWKNSGGTATDIITYNASNQVVIGNGTIYMQPTWGTTLLGLTGTTATVTGTFNATTDIQLNGTAYKDATQTFTNKTYNAESTGNVLTIPVKQYIQAAGCENTTPYAMLDLPTSNQPAATCLTGTNTQKGGLRFTAAGNQTAQYTWLVPADGTTTVDYRLLLVPATTAASTWQISYSCVSPGATDDPAWTTTTATGATATGVNTLTVWTLSAQTACSANQIMHLKVARTDTTGPATVDLLGLEITSRRAM